MDTSIPCRTLGGLIVSAVILVMPTGVRAGGDVIDLEGGRWVFKDAEIVQHLGRSCLSGTAWLKDAEFDNGIIEVDLAVGEGRSYPGIIFRMQSEGNFECFYVRPHASDLYYNVLQYVPVFNGVTGWQLYAGDGFTAPGTIPVGEWIHLRMEVHGTQARVYLGSTAAPALVIPRLKHGLSKGTVGVLDPGTGDAYFSNFRYQANDDLAFEESPEIQRPSGTITEWEISRTFPGRQFDGNTYPSFFTIFQAQWEKIEAEPSGLVDIARYRTWAAREADCVFARTIIRADQRRDIEFSFGYSDDVSIFLNGKKVFSGRNGYHSRDPAFAGIVGLNDTLCLPLAKGLNEIFLMVTERFGGWGFMGKLNRRLKPPLKEHGLLTRVWETSDSFRIPESVLYDPRRDILYVSSFNRVGAAQPEAGFISRVNLDGEIVDLNWVTGLDGPCGMGIYGDRLYVVEGPRGNLVEIDIDRGEIVNRYPVPGHEFANDVATDASGNIYVSNTSRSPRARDIYKCVNGECSVWHEGDELHRANGLFVNGNELLVGNTGDGLFKAVNLDDGRVRTIVSLGAGVIDGIRVDNDGHYLVSQWEGKTYRISPAGDVVEILDTTAEGLNMADFEFVKKRNLLIIPTFLGNKVTAYELSTN